MFEKFVSNIVGRKEAEKENVDRLLEEYSKDKVEMEEQLIPPICLKIETGTIAKMVGWRKKLKKLGMKELSEEAKNLAFRGGVGHWINKLRRDGGYYDRYSEEILEDIVRQEKRNQKDSINFDKKHPEFAAAIARADADQTQQEMKDKAVPTTEITHQVK